MPNISGFSSRKQLKDMVLGDKGILLGMKVWFFESEVSSIGYLDPPGLRECDPEDLCALEASLRHS